MRQDETWVVDPVDAFKSKARVGGNKLPTGEGFLPVDLLGKGDDVANLVDSCLTGRRVATALRKKRQVDLHPRYRGLGVGLPHLKPTAI